MLPVLFPLIVDHMRKEIILKGNTKNLPKTKHVQTISNDSMVGKAEGDGPISWHHGTKISHITTSCPA